MAFRPFLSSSGISPVVRGRWAGPLLLVYILWYNIYSLLCPDGCSRAAPPLSCCCGHCRCHRCPRRHLYCGGCRANPNIPPSSSSSICSARQNFLHFVSSSGVSLVVRGRWDNPLLSSVYYGILSVVCCVRMDARWPCCRSFVAGATSVLVTFFIMVAAGFLAPSSSSFCSAQSNLLYVVGLLHFLLLPPSSFLPPLASRFLPESAYFSFYFC